MPERLVDLAPGAIGVLRWVAKEEIRVNLVPGEIAGFLQVLKARGLIEYDEATETLAVVRLTSDGKRLLDEGHF